MTPEFRASENSGNRAFEKYAAKIEALGIENALMRDEVLIGFEDGMPAEAVADEIKRGVFWAEQNAEQPAEA